MNLQTLTPPSGEPLSLADAKLFARVGSDHEDDLLGQLIAAARARVEAETGLALVTRTLRLTLTDWPLGVLERGAFRLPRAPAARLVTVRLRDGEVSEDATDRFELTAGLSPRLTPQPFGAWAWPRSVHERIEIDWVAGFGDSADVPEDLVEAVKLVTAHAFEYRNATDWRAEDALKDRLKALLQPWREMRI